MMLFVRVDAKEHVTVAVVTEPLNHPDSAWHLGRQRSTYFLMTWKIAPQHAPSG
jgi:hypothetical protein